jgi:hypothetical protein
MWRRRLHAEELGEIVGLLHGLGAMLMRISATLDEIASLLRDEDDDEADA